MKVQNMTSSKGNKVANQFIIEDYQDGVHKRTFQSYDSVIVEITTYEKPFEVIVHLDKTYWDYSAATGKYRNQFLGETKKETQAKIDSGEYILTDLN